MRATWLGLALCVATTACTDLRYFAPRENLNGTGPGGFPAAVYPLQDGAGQAVGEVRLFSRGARGEVVEDGAGREVYRVEVHVGFELENTGETGLELAAIHSEGEALSLVRMEGETVAAAGSTAHLDTWFLAPEARSARGLQDFAVRFEVLADGEPVMTQVTPFGRWAPQDPRRYDPWFFSAPFGVGFGMGWYWHRH